jgi:hypothetical protein
MLDGETNRAVWSENERANFGDVRVELDALLLRIAGTIQNYFHESKLRRALSVVPSSDAPFNDYARVMEMMFRSTPESALEAQRMSPAAMGRHCLIAWNLVRS